LVIPFPDYGGTFFDSEGVPQPIQFFSPDIAYALDTVPEIAWRCDRMPGIACLFPSQGFWTLTSPPPDFTPIDPDPFQGAGDDPPDCTDNRIDAFYIDEILFVRAQLNPPP
jgi:hypothetical protein